MHNFILWSVFSALMGVILPALVFIAGCAILSLFYKFWTSLYTTQHIERKAKAICILIKYFDDADFGYSDVIRAMELLMEPGAKTVKTEPRETDTIDNLTKAAYNQTPGVPPIPSHISFEDWLKHVRGLRGTAAVYGGVNEEVSRVEKPHGCKFCGGLLNSVWDKDGVCAECKGKQNQSTD